MRSNIARTACGSGSEMATVPTWRPGRQGREDARNFRGGTLNPLPDRCDALADANAHGRQSVLGVAMRHLAHQRAHQPRAARPQGMTKRDRAAVDVHLLLL